MFKKTSFILLISALFFALSACSTSSSVQNLESQLAELQAKEAIKDLFVDYGRSLDERNYEWFATLFSEDATFGGGDSAVGPQAIAASLENSISTNASGANLHMFSNEKIIVDGDSDTATATSRGAFYVQDEIGNPTALMYVTYVDELVRIDNVWKFKSRQLVGDIPGPPNESR